MTLSQYIRVLGRHLRPYRGTAGLVGLLLGVDVVFSAVWPLSFKFLIDRLTPTPDLPLLTKSILALFAAVLIASVASLLRDYGYAVLGSRVLRDVRRSVFGHLQKMSMGFFMSRDTGDLLARFSSDLASLDGAVTSFVAGFLLGSAGIVVSAPLLFFLEWRLASLTAFGLLLCVLLPRPLMRAATKLGYRIRRMESEVGTAAQENILSQPAVQAFGLHGHFITRFEHLTETLEGQSVKFKFVTSLAERVPNVVILIFEVLVMGLGLLLVATGRRTLGTIIAFHGVFLNIVYSVQTLTMVMPGLLQSVGGLQRVEELLDEKPEIADATDATALAPLRDGIEFKDVTFSYGGERKGLDKVCLKIPRGASVAFVGGSGSGKSTVLNLILRFYEPQSGAVIFDGTDLRAGTLESLRSQMGVVFQDSNLFNLTLRENIRLGRPQASDQEVEQAARQAEIHDWITTLPAGYGTMAGERGAKLSGGQRQRLAIARALARRPNILVLDEATSALDPAAEAAINATLRKLSAGRTVISVTHRLASARDADLIYMMESGRVAESGTHQQLLSAGGAYANLWWRQSGFTINEGGDYGWLKTEALRNYPVLSDLDFETLGELAPLFVAESYPAGRNVVNEGENGDRFYLIARGRVEVLRGDLANSPIRLAALGDGDYFGEMALVRRVPRMATVRTLTPTLLFSLNDNAFQRLLQRHPGLHERLQKRMTAASDCINPEGNSAR